MASDDRVAVIIPSQNRPGSLLKAVESVLTTTNDVQVVCVLGDENDGSRGILDRLGASKPEYSWRLQYHVLPVAEYHTAERWNYGAARALGSPDYFVIGADDVEFQPGWLEAAMSEMKRHGGSGVVALNDGTIAFEGEYYATHFMVSRKYAARGLGGVIMIPAYEHNFTDREVTERAKRDKMLFWAPDAKILHKHPTMGFDTDDDIYEKGDASFARDEALFMERRESGFPNDFEPVLSFLGDEPGWGNVTIGLRCFRNVPWQFLRNWSFFLMHGLEHGDRLIDIAVGATKPHHVAANDLIEAFLSTDSDSLLLVDDDMIIPINALHNLRRNEGNFEYDVVQAFATHKTFPPHAVAYVLRDEQPGPPESFSGPKYNALANLPDSGVVEVDAVGMAFTLIKRHVVESMVDKKYGERYTAWVTFGGRSDMEDMRFSRACKSAGFRLAVDTSAKIGHLGDTNYGWNEHKMYVNKMLENNNG